MTGRAVFPVMGTMASIVAAPSDVDELGEARIARALAAARTTLESLDQRFSHHRADSDINRWVAGRAVSTDAVAEIEHVLRQCGLLHGASDGVFRARNPRTQALDTAGYVKGYAISAATSTLRCHGLRNVVVGVGGDAFCSGVAAFDRAWRVAVQDPTRTYAVVAMIEAGDQGVATSGQAQRGAHIWNQRTSGDLLSFTVVGPDIAQADAFATIGFAMGASGMEWVRVHEGYRSIVVLPDGTVRSDAALVSAA